MVRFLSLLSKTKRGHDSHCYCSKLCNPIRPGIFIWLQIMAKRTSGTFQCLILGWHAVHVYHLDFGWCRNVKFVWQEDLDGKNPNMMPQRTVSCMLLLRLKWAHCQLQKHAHGTDRSNKLEMNCISRFAKASDRGALILQSGQGFLG